MCFRASGWYWAELRNRRCQKKWGGASARVRSFARLDRIQKFPRTASLSNIHFGFDRKHVFSECLTRESWDVPHKDAQKVSNLLSSQSLTHLMSHHIVSHTSVSYTLSACYPIVLLGSNYAQLRLKCKRHRDNCDYASTAFKSISTSEHCMLNCLVYYVPT